MGEFLKEHGLVCVHSQNTFIELPSRSLGVNEQNWQNRGPHGPYILVLEDKQ